LKREKALPSILKKKGPACALRWERIASPITRGEKERDAIDVEEAAGSKEKRTAAMEGRGVLHRFRAKNKHDAA